MKKLLVLAVIVCLLVSLQVSAKPNPRAAGPDGPSGLTATATSTSEIILNWQDNSDDEDGFKIERSLDGESFSEIDEVGQDVTSYSDQGLEKNTTYYYRVRAFRVLGNKNRYSAYSNVASDTTFNEIPAAPTNLQTYVYSTSTGTWVSVYWQDNSDNEDGFKLERGTNGIDFSQIATTTYSSYADWDVESGQTYYYRVKAYNEVGDSEYSNVASSTIP